MIEFQIQISIDDQQMADKYFTRSFTYPATYIYLKKDTKLKMFNCRIKSNITFINLFLKNGLYAK